MKRWYISAVRSLLSRGNGAAFDPEGRPIIAQRFIAGSRSVPRLHCRPVGTVESRTFHFDRPSGTCHTQWSWFFIPAVNCRAIVEGPSGAQTLAGFVSSHIESLRGPIGRRLVSCHNCESLHYLPNSRRSNFIGDQFHRLQTAQLFLGVRVTRGKLQTTLKTVARGAGQSKLRLADSLHVPDVRGLGVDFQRTADSGQGLAGPAIV